MNDDNPTRQAESLGHSLHGPTIPTRFVLCRNDRFFPATWLRPVVRDRLGIEPEEIDSGHCPALSQPVALATLLERYVADEVAERASPVIARAAATVRSMRNATDYRSAMPRDPNIPDAFDVYTLVLLRRPGDAPEMPERRARRPAGTAPGLPSEAAR